MINHKLSLIVVLIFIASCVELKSQKVYDKLAQEICKCMEKEKGTYEELFEFCMEKYTLPRINEIKEAQGAEMMEEIDGGKMGIAIGKQMIERCPTLFNEMVEESGLFPKVDKDENVSCEDLGTGEFYYLAPNENTLEMTDTTFVSMAGTHYYERMRGGRTYSHLDLEWLSACVFKVTFIESNDPFKKALSVPGDEYIYTVITNSKSAMFVSTEVGGVEYHVEMVKIE